MIIENINIQSFGKLNNVSINLNNGINLIYGQNEAGKSTISKFIYFIFYGLPSNQEEKKKLISWDTSRASGTITILHEDGKKYRIERDVIMATNSEGKSTFSEKIAIVDPFTNAVITKNKNPGEIFFGVDELIFKSTTYIAQVGEGKVDGESLVQPVENLLFSADEKVNTSKSIEKLEDVRKLLLHKNRKGGKIFELEQEKNRITSELEKAMNENESLINLSGKKKKLEEVLEDSNKKLAVVEKQIEEYDNYTIKNNIIKHNLVKNEISTLEKKLAETTDLKKTFGVDIASDDYINQLKDYKNHIRILESQRKELEVNKNQAINEMRQLEDRVNSFNKLGKDNKEKQIKILKSIEISKAFIQKNKIWLIISGACSLIFLTLAIISLFLQVFTQPVLKFVFSGIAVITLITTLILLFAHSKHKNNILRICARFGCDSIEDFDELLKTSEKDETFLLSKEEILTNASEDFKKKEEELIAYSIGINNTLGNMGFEIQESTDISLDSAIAFCQSKKHSIEQLKNSIQDKKSLLDSYVEFIKKYDETRIKNAYSSTYDEEAMSKVDYKYLQKNYEMIKNHIDSITKEISDITNEYNILSVNHKDAEKLSILKDSIDAKIEELTFKYDSYILAIDTLTTASSKLRSGISPKIASDASKIMSKMSNGKYSNIGVDDSFGMNYVDNVTHSIESLSSGTLDLAYLSLRISLLKLLFTNSLPPFVCDETFARMDDERIRNVLSVFKSLCKNNDSLQCIMFTCHTREGTVLKQLTDFNYLEIK